MNLSERQKQFRKAKNFLVVNKAVKLRVDSELDRPIFLNINEDDNRITLEEAKLIHKGLEELLAD